MLIALGILIILSAVAAAGTVVALTRDGYGAVREVRGYDSRHPLP